MSDDPSTATVRPQDQIDNESPVSRFWGKVPADWKLVPGSSVYTVNPNPKPETEPCTYIEMDALDEELPWPKHFGERRATDYSGKTFRAGDTLMARITPCTENGKAALVPELPTEVGIGSTEYAVLSPDINRISPWYLYYLIKAHPVHDYAIARMRGSTGRQRVPFSVFRRELDVPLPPLEEQRKIASVLYTVDQLMKKTKASVQTARKLRAGLRNRMFQRGLKDDGDVNRDRFGPVLAHMPSDWKRMSVEEIVHEHQLGTAERGGSESRRQIPLIKMGNLRIGEWDLSEVEYIERDEMLVDDLRLQRGDLLFNTRNTPELVGKTAVWDFDATAVYDNNLLRLRFDEAKVLSRYVNHYLSSGIGRRQLRSRVHGTTSVAAIYWKDLKGVEIPVPPVQTQRVIVNTLEGISDGIKIEKEYWRELIQVKYGLMQDLLSGVVRTGDKPIEVLDEVAAYG